MLSRFLACPELDYVIFGWVMHRPEIAQSILERLDLNDVTVFRYTVVCSAQTLRRRIEGDIRSGLRGPDTLERSLEYLPLYGVQDTVKIQTDGSSPQQTAEIIVKKMKE